MRLCLVALESSPRGLNRQLDDSGHCSDEAKLCCPGKPPLRFERAAGRLMRLTLVVLESRPCGLNGQLDNSAHCSDEVKFCCPGKPPLRFEGAAGRFRKQPPQERHGQMLSGLRRNGSRFRKQRHGQMLSGLEASLTFRRGST